MKRSKIYFNFYYNNDYFCNYFFFLFYFVGFAPSLSEEAQDRVKLNEICSLKV